MTTDTITAAALADLTGLSARRLRQLAEGGVITRTARGFYPHPDANRAIIRHHGEMAAGRGGEAALDLSRERARLASEQADQVAMKNATARGEYVLAAEVERRWTSILSSVRGRMLALPSKVQQRLTGLTRHDVEQIDLAVREALEEAADHVEARPNPETGVTGRDAKEASRGR